MTTTSKLQNLVSRGVHLFLSPFDPERCSAIGREVLRSRDYGAPIFLTEKEFDGAPAHFGTSPKAGANLIERFENDLEFVYGDPGLTETLTGFLGKGYDIFHRKIVCAFPKERVPEWLVARILGTPINCLNPYIRPEFRDVTYLLGSDFHMDVVDRFKWPDGTPRKKLMTFYVYLSEVTGANSPLVILPGSHRFGATVFPHALEMMGPDRWNYSDGRGRSMECRHAALTGGPGTAAVWHSCLLHGAPMNLSSSPRFALRYIVSSGGNDEPCGLDEVNRSLEGPLFLGDWEYRTDLDANGKPVLRTNFIGKIRFA